MMPTAAAPAGGSGGDGSDAAAANLRAAVLALYGMAGVEQAQANTWLTAFSHSPAAWEACLQLLDPGERAEVCFFCANLLLSKVRSEWHKLAPEQQANMSGVIRCVGLAAAEGARAVP
jgi:hypothetical protein